MKESEKKFCMEFHVNYVQFDNYISIVFNQPVSLLQFV